MTTTTDAVEALTEILRIGVNPSFRNQYEQYASFIVDNMVAKGFTIIRAAHTWQPIDTAPKDGTPCLLRFKTCLHQIRSDLGTWDGITAVMRNTGIKYGYWCFAAPVGHGGFPDEWFEGWMPLPPLPKED